MVVVAAFAAITAGVLVAAITVTLTMNQISHHYRQPISLTLRPAVFDRDVAAIDVTGFAQPFDESADNCGAYTLRQKRR